ncbi:MAG TPA: LptF/LptG family permease [Candidatus Cloacimonadota bacterium]|nr:LptF/LptG family permease [Candidatus Cloacimonadota bacterium]HOV16919.1 LptF/LptG family permease [Candidatus Cloacimonadota bacterium]HQL14165.1 LptF/LptG family permease [Candidatus Cloacimonadota bacterium]
MRILDKYITREYLKTFLILLFSLSVVFIAIDVIDNLPRLLRHGATFQEAFYYYLLRLPYLLILTTPVTILLTGLFLMNTLAKYNESVAIRAAGISIKRSMLPLFGFGLVMSIIVALFGEFVLPMAEAKRAYIYEVQIKGEQPEDQLLKAKIHFQGKNGLFYYFGFFDGYKNTIRIIDITQIDPANGEITLRITAAGATWQFNHWIVQDCEIRRFRNHVPISWQHFDSTVLPEMDVQPQDFVRLTKKTLSMNFVELRNYINRLKKVGDDYSRELVDLHMKIAYPLTNLIVIFFFIPVATSNLRSKGRGLIFMLGILVCFIYLTVLRIFQSLGYNHILSPAIAAWAPNIFFTVLGFFFLQKAEI